MDDVLTVLECARRLKVRPSTIYTAIAEQRLNHIRILGRIVIPKNELRQFKRRRNGDKSWVLKKAA